VIALAELARVTRPERVAEATTGGYPAQAETDPAARLLV
jgi:hypothetical protein